MSGPDEAMVSLEEVARALGSRADEVRRQCDELGLDVRADWSGRPGLAVRDARALADGSARRAAQGRAENAAAAAEAAELDARRVAAAREAYRKVVGDLVLTAKLQERAVEAARDAGRKVERGASARVRSRLHPIYHASWDEATWAGAVKRKLAGESVPEPGAEVSG